MDIDTKMVGRVVMIFREADIQRINLAKNPAAGFEICISYLAMGDDSKLHIESLLSYPWFNTDNSVNMYLSGLTTSQYLVLKLQDRVEGPWSWASERLAGVRR